MNPCARPCLNRCWCVLFTFLVALLPVSAELKIERIFGVETDTGPYKHPSTITELANGDLLLAYYGGGGEYEKATAVYGSRLKRGSKRWTKPIVLARNPMYSMGNPVLWQAPDKRIWLFYTVRPGETWESSRIAAKISDDDGKTWSESFMIAYDAGMMVRSRPIVLSDGHYLLPAYLEIGNGDIEMTGHETGSVFMRFDPKSEKWSFSEKVSSRIGNLQASVVELEPGHLLALCRRGGDYEPGNDGFVVRTESRDGGRTWSAGVETEFPNPNAAVDLIKLASGHLLFVYNHSMDERSPLRAVLSSDGGKSWPRQLDIATVKDSFAYPTVIQTHDGKIHITYTSDERATIRWAIFAEADLK